MTTKEISKLESGTLVYQVKDAKITSWITLGFHPKHKYYFYLISENNVNETMAIFINNINHGFQNEAWVTDYEVAKQNMWRQLKHEVKIMNKVYMDGKEPLNFSKDDND